MPLKRNKGFRTLTVYAQTDAQTDAQTIAVAEAPKLSLVETSIEI